MARPELNLLNYEIERSPSRNLEMTIGVTAIVLVALIMLAIWGIALRHDQKQRQEIEYLQRLQSRLPVVAADHRFESAQNKVLQKKLAIDQMQSSRMSWSQVLIDMEKSTPASVAVENIAAANDTIVIRGTVPDFSILIKLTESLSTTRCFRKVRVKKAERIEGQVNFEIWMLIRR